MCVSVQLRDNDTIKFTGFERKQAAESNHKKNYIIFFLMKH